MKGLKITISTILILLLLIFLALPAGIGLWTKHTYKKLIETLPATANASAKLIKYNVGWFHSTATIAVDLHTQGLSAQSAKSSHVRILLYNDIKQGPIIFAKRPNGANKTIFALSQTVTRAPSINFKSTTTWQFNNKIKSLFSSEQFKLNLSGDITLEIKGLRGAATYDASNQYWEGKINMDSGSLFSQLSPDVPPTTLATFTDIAYAGTLRDVALLGYGKQSLSFSTLKIMPSPDGQKNPVINNLTFTSHVGQNDETTNFQLTLNANKIDDSKFDINRLALTLGVENLNTNALHNLLRISRAENKNTRNPVAFAKMSNASIALFRQGFSLKLKQLRLDTSQGRVDAKGYLTLPKLDKNANVIKATTLASGELQIQVPKQWLIHQVVSSTNFFKNKHNVTPDQLPIQATTIVQQWENDGYLISKANDYVSTISYKNGKLLINGKVPDLKKKPDIQPQPAPQPENDTHPNGNKHGLGQDAQ